MSKRRTTTRAAALAFLAVLVTLLAVGRLPSIRAEATAAPARDFTVTSQPISAAVQVGRAATYTVSVTPSGGFSGTVALTASGLSAGMSATFAPASLQVGPATRTSTLTVTTSSSTPTGSHSFTVTGASGPTKRTLALTVVVSAPAPPGIAVAVTPGSISVAPGSTAVYAVSVSRLNGYSGPISLSTSSTLPKGASVSVSPTSIPAGTSSPVPVTLTVGTAGTTPASTTRITVRAGGFGITSTVDATLVVDTNQSAKAFTITSGILTPVAPGAGAPVDLVLTNPNNQPIRVTNLGVTVRATSAAACGTGQFTVRQYAGSYPLTVPANSSGVRLTSLGVPAAALPLLAMVNSTADQSACKGATISLAYTGSATNQ